MGHACKIQKINEILTISFENESDYILIANNENLRLMKSIDDFMLKDEEDIELKNDNIAEFNDEDLKITLHKEVIKKIMYAYEIKETKNWCENCRKCLYAIFSDDTFIKSSYIDEY